MVDKNSNIVEQFYISFLRLNLGGSVRGGCGLTILIFKGGKNSLFLVRGVDTTGIIYFQIRGVTEATCWVGQNKSGGINFIFICSFTGWNHLKLFSVFILCIYIVVKWEYTSFCYKKYIRCFEFLTVSIQKTIFFISFRLFSICMVLH